MPMGYNRAMTIQNIAHAINANRLVVVCGAGTTAFTMPSSPYKTWRALLEDGIRTVVENGVDEEEWAKLQVSQLDIARQPSDYASVAQNVSSRLGKRGFIDWLHKTVGSLQDPEKPELIQAIANLGTPIATTNYDALIERVTNWERVTWRSPENMQRALLSQMRGVMHLHGSYLEPDSVVFGSESYGAIVDNRSAQSIQWLIAGGHSILFVGASGTLEDPNLGKLMARIDQDIPDSGNPHYLLCRQSERDQLVERYNGSTVHVISFGSDNYDDLPKFFDDVAAAAGRTTSQIARQSHHMAARGALLQRVQSESIVAIEASETITDIDSLIVPPVLLCAPHEKILSSIEEYEGGKKNIRADPAADANSEGIIVVVGEEISGVTTALEWLILTRTAQDNERIPVLVDFSELQKGVRGLDRLVRRSLGESCGVAPNEELSGIVLGVDDVVPRLKNRTFERFIDDLESEWIEGCVLGCALGAEPDLIAALDERGLQHTVRYMGRMTTKDVRALVLLAVSDDRADAMLEKVQQTLNVEGLPKTAWNIALLLDVFIKTSITLQSVTPITLLDQFVSSLLGREIFEDSRIGIDARDREAILAALASMYAEKRAGALPEDEVIKFFTDLFEEFGWNESPTAMLDSLKTRHVLTTRRTDPKNVVRFAQSSYLYLFAAKQAKEHPPFKEQLLEDPLFYGKIISHYTALVRNDEDVLARVLKLVDRDECSDERSASIFGPAPEGTSDHPLGLDSVVAAVTEASEHAEEGAVEGAGGDDISDIERDPEDAETNEDWDYLKENAVTRSSEPFPARNVKDAPHLQVALTALSLVSNVLRDSELVRNMTLKVTTLKKTVHLWAEMVYLFEKDDEFQEFTASLAEHLAEDTESSDKKLEKAKEKLQLQFPLFFGMTAMMGSLSSRKLEVAIDKSFDELVEENPKAAIMLALLSWSIESTNWPQHFTKAADKFSKIPAVFDFMFFLARGYYLHEKMTAEQRSQLETFLRTILSKGGYNVGRFIELLRADRARIAASSKAIGSQ